MALDQYSDTELERIAVGGVQTITPAPVTDLTQYSDADLEKLARPKEPTKEEMRAAVRAPHEAFQEMQALGSGGVSPRVEPPTNPMVSTAKITALMPFFPAAGIAGIAQKVARYFSKEPDKLMTPAEVVNFVSSIPVKYLDENEQKAVELLSWPIAKSGEGWREIAKLTGIPGLEPWLGTMGEAAAVFAAPGEVAKIGRTRIARAKGGKGGPPPSGGGGVTATDVLDHISGMDRRTAYEQRPTTLREQSRVEALKITGEELEPAIQAGLEAAGKISREAKAGAEVTPLPERLPESLIMPSEVLEGRGVPPFREGIEGTTPTEYTPLDRGGRGIPLRPTGELPQGDIPGIRKGLGDYEGKTTPEPQRGMPPFRGEKVSTVVERPEIKPITLREMKVREPSIPPPPPTEGAPIPIPSAAEPARGGRVEGKGKPAPTEGGGTPPAPSTPLTPSAAKTQADLVTKLNNRIKERFAAPLSDRAIKQKAKAEKLGVKYEGEQEHPKGYSVSFFTDPKSGSTFNVEPGQLVAEKLAASRKINGITPEGKGAVPKAPAASTPLESNPIVEQLLKDVKAKKKGGTTGKVSTEDMFFPDKTRQAAALLPTVDKLLKEMGVPPGPRPGAETTGKGAKTTVKGVKEQPPANLASFLEEHQKKIVADSEALRGKGEVLKQSLRDKVYRDREIREERAVWDKKIREERAAMEAEEASSEPKTRAKREPSPRIVERERVKSERIKAKEQDVADRAWGSTKEKREATTKQEKADLKAATQSVKDMTGGGKGKLIDMDAIWKALGTEKGGTVIPGDIVATLDRVVSRIREKKKGAFHDTTNEFVKGPIVKHRELGTAENSLKAPPVTEGERGVVKGLPNLPSAIGHWSWETIPTTFDRLGKGAKELHERPMDIAVHNLTVEFQGIAEKLRGMKKGLSWGAGDRIGTYLLGERQHGGEYLKATGVKEVKTLIPAEMVVAKQVNKEFGDWFNRLQDARSKSGLSPFKKADNYITFFQNLDIWQRMGIDITKAPTEMLDAAIVHMRSTPFHFLRRKPNTYRVMTDAFDIYKLYSQQAAKHVHIGPEIAKGRELINDYTNAKGKVEFSLRDSSKNTYRFLSDFYDAMAGQKIDIGFLKDYPWVEKGISKLQENLAVSTLGGNTRSILVQLTSLLPSYVEMGPKFFSQGLADFFSGAKKAEMMKSSNKVVGRLYDASTMNVYADTVLGKTGKVFKGAKRTSMLGLSFMDGVAAKITYLGAKRMAESVGLQGKKAVHFADDLMVRTQGSAAAVDRAPIQQHVVGRAMTVFQTFVIANWSWLKRHGIGKGNPDISNPKVFLRAMELVGGMVLVNMFFEEVLNTQSPFPAPIRAYKEARERGATKGEGLLESGLELSQLVPMIGGLRYGSSPAGAVADYVESMGELFSQRPGPIKTFMSTKELGAKKQSALRLAAQGSGLPGTGQTLKSIRAYRKGEEFPAVLFSTKPTVRSLHGGVKYREDIKY